MQSIRELWRQVPVGWRPLVWAWIAVTIALCAYVPFRAESGSDFRDFWRTAGHFRQTGELSSELGVHNYLPVFTIFMQLWSFLPLPAAIVLWTLTSSAVWALTTLLTELLLNDGLAPKPRRATYAAILLMAPYVLDCAVLGQLALILAFLVVLAWFLATRGEEWFAAVSLALATVVKLMPAALIPFFLIRGRWQLALATTLIAALLAWGVPLSVIGATRTAAEHAAYRARAVAGHSAYATIHAEKPQKAKYSNNALPIVLRRLLTRVDYDPRENRPPKFVNFVDLPRPIVWWIYALLLALLLTISVAAIVRSGARWPPQSLAELHGLQAQFGVWCCVMLLATPLLWTHYLPLVYWPLAFLADRAEKHERSTTRRDRWTDAMIIVWLLAIVALAFPAVRAAGAQLLAVLALWLGCLRWSWVTGPVDPPARGAAARSLHLRAEGSQSATI